jgi:hypothetical protein
MSDYPLWRYYPAHSAPPRWAHDLVGAFADSRANIDSREIQGKQSDGILRELAPSLVELGYVVEASKQAADKITRPVLFGDQGGPLVRYDVDAVLDAEGVLLEIEAGRGMMGNAFYRDLIRSSLIVGARFLAVALMIEYRYKSNQKQLASRDFTLAHAQLDALYASGRLLLPFEGVLLIGY